LVLLRAVGCLIGSITGVLWYLVVWAGLIVFCGVFVYGIPAPAVLLGDWIDALAERRRAAERNGGGKRRWHGAGGRAVGQAGRLMA
jgi:hypothetical protein